MSWFDTIVQGTTSLVDLNSKNDMRMFNRRASELKLAQLKRDAARPKVIVRQAPVAAVPVAAQVAQPKKSFVKQYQRELGGVAALLAVWAVYRAKS